MSTNINTAFDEAVKAGYKGSRAQFIKAFKAGDVGEYSNWKKFWTKFWALCVDFGTHLWVFGFIAYSWTATINYYFKQLTTVGSVDFLGVASFFCSSFLTYYLINTLIKDEKSKNETNSKAG